jgi:hypothetical protein
MHEGTSFQMVDGHHLESDLQPIKMLRMRTLKVLIQGSITCKRKNWRSIETREVKDKMINQTLRKKGFKRKRSLEDRGKNWENY